MIYLQQLKAMIHHQEDVQTIESSLQENIQTIFKTPDITQYYKVVKNTTFQSNECKIIQGWLALLSGDNMSLMRNIQAIDTNTLDSNYLSLYYDLKALSSLSGSPQERLAFNDIALQNVQHNKHTFFYANTHLTRGQIYNGLRHYRQAADYFHIAYKAFFATDMMFPASVSITNALLNWFRIGEFQQVHSIASQTLILMSQFQESKTTYWDVVKLPIGMTHASQMNIELAKEYLEASKKAIDDLGLVHMHGYVELFLLNIYYYKHDKKALVSLYKDTQKLFDNMHYPFIRVIRMYGDILLNHSIETSDIEFLQVFYDQTKDTGDLLPFEILLFLSIRYDSIKISIEDIEKVISALRFQGDLYNLSTVLLLLAEYYHKKKQHDNMFIILQEAIHMYHNDSIQFTFYRFPLTIWKYIHQIDSSISQNISKISLLTSKEQEIMRLIEKGKSNKEIAQELFISLGTVKWHINNIYSKLQVTSRIEAINKISK